MSSLSTEEQLRMELEEEKHEENSKGFFKHSLRCDGWWHWSV